MVLPKSMPIDRISIAMILLQKRDTTINHAYWLIKRRTISLVGLSEVIPKEAGTNREFISFGVVQQRCINLQMGSITDDLEY